jgi:hypothetical protein
MATSDVTFQMSNAWDHVKAPDAVLSLKVVGENTNGPRVADS